MTVFLDASARNGFASNPLNRMSEKRDDADFMAGLRQHPLARTLILCGDMPLLRQEEAALREDEPPNAALFMLSEAANFGTVREVVFLGMAGPAPLFSTLVEESDIEKMRAQGFVASDLRGIMAKGLLAPALLGAFGQAKSVMHWHRTHRFCSTCGAASRLSASGWRRECPACNAHHFPRTDPVVIMLAASGDACLLGRQPRFPAGMYSCLAGFLEPGETIEDAVRRELHEEAGITAGAVHYQSSQPWPFPGSLMIGCIAQVTERLLTIDKTELEDARWFSRDEAKAILNRTHPDAITCPPAFAIANQLMKSWVEDG